MSTGVGCRVYVDGARFNDGSPGEGVLDPAALTGLKVTWGRSSTTEQPDVSSCTFTVADPRGGASFLDVLRTGLSVEVHADGHVYPSPTTSTFLDPNLNGDAPPVVVTGGAGSASEGVFSIVPADPTRRVTAVFAPAPFDDGGNPAAWDAIPTTDGGQTWEISARVRLAIGGAAEITPVLFSGPWASSYATAGPPVAIPNPGGGWVDYAVVFQPGVSGRWVGLQVSTYPNGAAWSTLDRSYTWATFDPALSWLDMETTRVDTVNAFAPAEGTTRDVIVFAGRVTDLAAAWNDAAGALLIDVTCQDFTADLANVRVGDEPWTVEAMGARFDRVLALANIGVDARIADTLTDTLVSYQDVDSQPAADLLRDLAQTVDGVMWSAVHPTTGPYVLVEDPAERAPLTYLKMIGGFVEIVPGAAAADALSISACDVLRDPVTWVQDVSDVTTRASIGWLEQGVDDQGVPTTTDRTFTLVDEGLESVTGQRGISIGTLLQGEPDAVDVAERVLARTSQTGWRVNGLYIDDDTIAVADTSATVMMLDLLDGTIRNGAPLLLTDLPGWTPVPGDVGVFLEGGQYTYDEGADGQTWQLDLTVSNSAGLGQSITWDQLEPSWSWVEFDPSISWLALYGVGEAPAPPPALYPGSALYPSPTQYPSSGGDVT